MYDFKLYLPVANHEEEATLVFHVWIADKDSYYIQEVPTFGIHEVYKKIFTDMLGGSLKTTNISIMKDGSVVYDEKSITSCGNTINNEYLECCKKFLESELGLIVEINSFEMHQMIELRYDAPDMNLQYGISPNISKKIYSFTNEFVDIIHAENNTNYGGILQQQAQAGSTLIPYLCERIDAEANKIIEKVINDINQDMVDRNFANSNNKYANLYKKIVKKMKELKSIKDLETFEVYLYNMEGNKTKKSLDISKLSNIENQLFGDKVEKQGMVRKPAYQMKSRPNIHSAEIDIDDKVYAIHINTENKYFEKLKRVLKENEGKKVAIEGYKEAEYTILATDIDAI